jgi:hypothetical protein
VSARYEFLSGGFVAVTREEMEEVSQEEGLQNFVDGDIYLILGDPGASAAVLSGSKSSVLDQLNTLIATVENAPGNDDDDHAFVDDGTDMHLCAWGRTPYQLVYRYGQQYDGVRIEQVTDLHNGWVNLRLQDGRTIEVEPNGDDALCGDAADSQNHRNDQSVITTPLSEIDDAPKVTAKVDDDRVGTVSIKGWEIVAHESSTDPGFLNVEIAGDNLDDADPTAAQLKVHINEHLIYMGNTQGGPDHVCSRCGTNTSDPDILETADERCMATPNGVGPHDLRPLPL